MTVSTRYRFDGLSATYRVRQSGTVLILVVVILALMALIGVAYIQVSRTTLMATKKPISGLDAACHSVVGQIQATLLKDLYSDGTKLFDASKYLSPYDYPWTNTANDWPTTVKDQDGNAFATQPKGGRFDDAWLASSCPTFSPDTTPIVTWPHITNLNGIFLQIPALGAASGNNIVEDPINFASGDNTKTDKGLQLAADLQANPANYETYGADADGDGILDSRWTWTPLRRFGNLVYVCAVRIIDNSSMINVNTATSLTKDGGTLETADNTRPRGYYPSDVDLSRLLYAGSASWSSDLNALYTYRNVANSHTTNPTLMGLASLPSGYPASGYGAADTRSGTWFLNGQYYGKETGGTLRGIYYHISDELELRYKNGLNNSNSGTVNIKTQMPNLTRSAVTTETYYGNVSGVTADAAGQALYFQGGTAQNIVDRTSLPEVRKMLTTRSGAAAYSNNPNRIWNSIYSDWGVAVPSTERFLKYDLLYQDGGGRGTDAANLARAQRIGSIIHTVFSLGAGSGKGYLGTTTPADSNLLTQIATEYMLAIKDYNDADSVPSMTQIGGSGPKYYGIEACMPFIREVYVQTAFTGSDNYTTFSPALGPSDGKADTWTHAGSASDCFVIELGNPFDRQINCDRIQLAIGGATYTFPSGTTIDARSYKIFYIAPSSDTTDQGYTAFPTSLSLPGASVDITGQKTGTLTLSTGSPLEVQLKVNVAASGPADYQIYDRLTNATFVLNTTPIIASTAAEQDGSSATIGRHRQARLTRACNSASVSSGGVHYLSNKKMFNDRSLPTNSNYLSNNNLSKFGSDAKGVTGDAKLDGFMMPVPNRPFFSVAELGKILMIGFTDETTGDLPQRLSGTDGTGGFLNGTGKTGPGRLFLDFSTTATVPTATTTWPDPMPHAAMLLNEFTTLSPAYDGVNNTTATTGDPAVDTNDQQPAEQFVPGLININTAPLHIATLACPLPESINDIQDLMAAIAHYRDTNYTNRATLTGLASADMRINPGIASLGELMHIKPAATGDIPNNKSSSVTTATLSMQRYAQDTGATADNKDLPINLYPMPEEISATVKKVAAVNGPNELLSRFQFLSQVYTTRSDIFTAYVVVRGYRDNDYGKGPVESATFIAVFDRSGVTSSSGTVKLLAYQRIN